MPNQNNVIPYQYNIKFFRVFLRNRHPRKLHNLYLCFTKKARTQSTSIFIEGVSNSALCQPAQQAFPCGLGARNEERESKTARKMAQVKEPLSFFGSYLISRAAKTENPVPRSFFAPKLNGNACYAGQPFADRKNLITCYRH